MTKADYDVKIRVINGKIATLTAQKAELVHKQKTLADNPVKKRAVPKKPSLKKGAKK